MNSDNCDQLRAYYQALHWSVKELVQMRLVPVLSIEKDIYRDDYTGYSEFIEWRDSHYPDWEDPENFGLEGMEITGCWNSDKSIYRGFFPVKVLENGSTQITSKHIDMSMDQLLNQIQFAEEHQLLLGLSAKPSFIWTKKRIPNSILFADIEALNILNDEHDGLRIETDGSSCWAYGYTDFESDDIGRYFLGKNSKLFKLRDDDSSIGRICRGLIQPCYPSIVFGTQVKLVQTGRDNKVLFIPSAKEAKIDLDFEDNLCEEEDIESLDDDDGYEWQNWSCEPDEDERLFNEAVRKFEQLLKIDKSIIRHAKQSKEDVVTNAVDLCTHKSQESFDQNNQQWLDRLFPADLADACRCLTKNLPYDEITVSLAYLAGIASLLKLGTKINGNPLTKFEVPPNLYLAFVGKSGTKKTPLKGILVDDPAHPIQLELSSQYTRQLRKWEEDCRGLNGNDRPSKPTPLKIRTQDYSAEGLVCALQKADEYGQSFGVFRDELNGLFKNMNRYTKGNGGDEEQLLELFDGKPFDSSRVANSRSYQRCSVTIYGNLQPRIFADLTKDPDATGQWARFLFVPLPAKTVPLPVECTEEEQREVEVATNVLKNYAVRAYELSPMIYILDQDARRLFSEYEHDKQMGVHSSIGETQSALHGKSAGKVLRIAGLKHILAIINASPPSPESIGVDALKTAMALVDGCDHWALSQYTRRGVTVNSRITKEMRRLHNLAWKLKKTVTWTQIKDCLSSKETQSMDRMKAEDIFRQLESMGYGEVSFGSRGGLCYRALKPLPFE